MGEPEKVFNLDEEKAAKWKARGEESEKRMSDWKANFTCGRQCEFSPPHIPMTEKEKLIWGQDAKCPLFSRECWAWDKYETIKLERRLVNGGLPEAQVKEPTEEHCISDNIGKTLVEWDKAGDTGKVLVLAGNTGVGKTYNVILWLKRKNLLGNFPPFVFYYVNTLAIKLRNYTDDESEGLERMVERLKHIPILILDDMGVEKPSEFLNTIWDDVFNYREGGKLATIITTNRDPQTFEEYLGQRINDRLKGRWSEGGKWIRHFAGESKRKKVI